MHSPCCLPAATLSSTSRVRLSGVSVGSVPVTPPPPPSVSRLASELCSSLDRDGLRTSSPPPPGPDELEPEPLALRGAGTTWPVPVAEGQQGASSLSGLQTGGEKREYFIGVHAPNQNQNQRLVRATSRSPSAGQLLSHWLIATIPLLTPPSSISSQ